MQADQTTYSSSTSNVNKNASVGLYGTNAGQASISYQAGNQKTTGVTQRNATLTAGGSGTIDVRGDMSMIGANVNVKDLSLSVGGNLYQESLQDTQSITGSSKGGSISGGMQGLTGLSMNKGSTSGERAWVETQTGINGSNSANINVGGSTTLKGAYVANIGEDGKDHGKLNFRTNGLAMSDIQDTDTYESESMGGSVNISYDDKNTKDRDESGKGGSLDYANSSIDKEQTTKATIGSGNINVGTTTGTIHRDTANMQEITKDESDSTEFYVSDQTVALASNPIGEIGKLATNVENLPTKIQEQSKDIMPSSIAENKFHAALGAIVDTISGATGGIIPSNGTNGGLLGNIPVLLGAGDINNQVIQVKSEGMLTDANRDDFVPMQESDYYKSADPATQKKLDALGNVFVSRAPVSINADNVTYQNGTNGMLNGEGLALANVVTQTHVEGDTNINVTLNYNPTHGFFGDVTESAIDKNRGTTGIAKQTGGFVYDVTAARPDANFANHSQGNILMYSGVKHIKNNGGFDFGANSSGKGGHKVDLPTAVGFGNPMSYDDMNKLFNETGFNFTGNFSNPNDWVAEGLGGNTGDNGRATILQRLNLINTSLLFDLPLLPPSPHSTYNCDPSKGQICGDRQ